MVTIYTNEDRKNQLIKLSGELEALCMHLEHTGLFPKKLSIYMSCKRDVKTLLDTSFSQPALSELSRAIPDIYSRHRDWQRPLEQTEDGLREPDWFKILETHLQPVLKRAQVLREIGYY